jgi:hypothetical protein
MRFIASKILSHLKQRSKRILSGSDCPDRDSTGFARLRPRRGSAISIRHRHSSLF